MARLAAGAALLLLLAALAPGSAAAKKARGAVEEGGVVILTDENFDRLTASGQWMVDIYAPWCSHCQQLDPAWRLLAAELRPHDIKVAKIDGTKQRGLMKRFAVTGFPSIFFLRGGQAWHYVGGRSVAEMKDFALDGYSRAKPLPWHKAPNSALGRAAGLLYSLPAFAKAGYEHLRHERGFSDGTIIAGALLLPLAVGGVFICALDALYSRHGAGPFAEEHEHYA